MAHWGIATTLFQPLWPTRPTSDDLMRGWTEIQSAKAMDPPTQRERHLVAATEAFFREPETADWWTRIGRWAEAMETAYGAEPDDPDTAALYALSRLALASVAENRGALQDEAETVLRGVYDQMPRIRAPFTTRSTPTKRPAAPTGRWTSSRATARSRRRWPSALHMPSHIFIRLGEWPAVIDWNRRSADAALEHPAGDAVSHHFLHATDYLLYSPLAVLSRQRELRRERPALKKRASSLLVEGNTNCASAPLGKAILDRGPEAPYRRQGAVMWQIESGEGRFKGAQGLITSNFIISDAGEVIDHHTGVIFVT